MQHALDAKQILNTLITRDPSSNEDPVSEYRLQFQSLLEASMSQVISIDESSRFIINYSRYADGILNLVGAVACNVQESRSDLIETLNKKLLELNSIDPAKSIPNSYTDKKILAQYLKDIKEVVNRAVDSLRLEEIS
jgi:hypothetical protein